MSEVQKSASSGTPLTTSNARKIGGKESPLKAQIQKSSSADIADDKPALPAKARWATSWTTTAETKVDSATDSEITPDNFGPSLTDALTLPQKPKHSPSLPKRKEKRIPRSTKAVRLDMIDAAILAPSSTGVTASSKPEVVSENEKEEMDLSKKDDVKETEELKLVEKTKVTELPAPVAQAPKAPKGWAIIPTVKPETAKPPALAKLGQIPLPTRGEKRPARADNSKRKEKRQTQQQKTETKDQLPESLSDAPLAAQDKVMEESPFTECVQAANEQERGDAIIDTDTTSESQRESTDIQLDTDIVLAEQVDLESPVIVSSVPESSLDKDHETHLENDSLMVGDSADNEELMVAEQDNAVTAQSDVLQDSITAEEMAEDFDEEEEVEVIDNGDDIDDAMAITIKHEKLRDMYESSDSEADDQSSYEFDGEEDIEKLLSDEVDEEFDLLQSYPVKEDLSIVHDDRNLPERFDEGSNHAASQHEAFKPMKLPPGLDHPGMNPPMTPPPFGFSPMHHQTLPPFMHRGFPPGLMPPPGMLPRGYDPFMGQDAEMMMARRLQHSQQMIAALGMMNTGDRSRGPPNLPPPPPMPMPMHGPPRVLPQPPHLGEHSGPMFHSGSPSHGQLHGHAVQSPFHSPFGYRGDAPSPLRDHAMPPPQHSPYQQVTQTQDIQPLQHSSLPENNQVRSMQEGFRALLPNVNISFGPSAGGKNGNMQNNQQVGDEVNRLHGNFSDDTGMYSVMGQAANGPPPFPSNQSASNMNGLGSKNRHDTTLPHVQQSALQSPTGTHSTHGPSVPFGMQPSFHGSDAIQPQLNDVRNSVQRQPTLQKSSYPPGLGPQQQAATDISDDFHKLHLSPFMGEDRRSPMSSQGMRAPEMMPPVAQNESIKDIRAEAQNFFGNFLKQAAAHQQQAEKPNGMLIQIFTRTKTLIILDNRLFTDTPYSLHDQFVDTTAKSQAPFNDPAIMAARVASPQSSFSQQKFSEPMQSPIHTNQYRPSPPTSQNQAQDPRNHPMDSQSYQQRPPMFSPPPGLMPSMMQPPYMFRNNMQGPPGMPPPPQSYMHGPSQSFPMLPPDIRVPPPGMSPEEHHHRLEQFMRANSGSSL